MKKLMFLFLLAFAVNSCSSDDAVTSQEFLLPIESVTIPSMGVANNVTTMMIKYRRPTDCHIFNGFDIRTEGNTSTIGIRSLKFNQPNCMVDDESIYELPMHWTPTENGMYTFKFWIGDDSSGAPQFIEQNIIVE